jgi:hypothetical protein
MPLTRGAELAGLAATGYFIGRQLELSADATENCPPLTKDF